MNRNTKKFYNGNNILYLNIQNKYLNIYNNYLKGNYNAESDKYIYYLLNGYKKMNKNIICRNNEKNIITKEKEEKDLKNILSNQYYCCICMNLYPKKKIIFFECGHYCCLGCFIKINKCHLCNKKNIICNSYLYKPKILFYTYMKFFYKIILKKYGIKLILLYYYLKLNKDKQILLVNNYEIFNHNILNFNNLFYKLTNFNVINDNNMYNFKPENIGYNYDVLLICDITYDDNKTRINFLNKIKKINCKCEINQIIIKNTIEEKISKNQITFFT